MGENSPAGARAAKPEISGRAVEAHRGWTVRRPYSPHALSLTPKPGNSAGARMAAFKSPSQVLALTPTVRCWHKAEVHFPRMPGLSWTKFCVEGTTVLGTKQPFPPHPSSGIADFDSESIIPNITRRASSCPGKKRNSCDVLPERNSRKPHLVVERLFQSATR